MTPNKRHNYNYYAWGYLTLAVIFYLVAYFLPKNNIFSLSIGTGLEIGAFILLPFIVILFMRAWRERRQTRKTEAQTANVSTPTAQSSSSLRNPIIIVGIIVAIVIATVLALPQYASYQEQSARRECAEQIVQKKQEIEQALAEWTKREEQLRETARKNFTADKASAEETYEDWDNLVDLYDKKPPSGNITVDEERKLIKL